MITPQVLGRVGRDNALWCRLETGQHIYRLLFDCGSYCIPKLGVAEAHELDYLFFSHLHMDHIAGFDDIFRLTFNRMVKRNSIYGPAETSRIVQHRMQGYRWSHVDGHPARWWLHDILPDRVVRTRFNLGERFAQRHNYGSYSFDGWLEFDAFRVRVFHLHHGTIPSLGYMVQERGKRNIDKDALVAHRLPAGRWLQQLKDDTLADDTPIRIEAGDYTLGELRAKLLVARAGASLAYLSDFYLDDAGIVQLAAQLRGCDTLVCESQYVHEDEALAQRNAHMTCTRVAHLAAHAGVGKLILFHVSERYRNSELRTMLAQARAIFTNTYFPEHWQLG